ncbi:MAG: hypothetical protein HUJ98_10840, partial [Bacteroidaceae bacterium]|nr:hypothetical protein [Bacteroidaceae bacterium]
MKSFLSKLSFTKLIIAFAMAVTALLVLMQSPLSPWKYEVVSSDIAVFKYVAHIIEEGGMPYRDVFDHKGPLIFLLNVVGDLISSYRGIWIVEYAFMLATIIGMYMIARLYCSPMMSCFLAVMCTTPLNVAFQEGNLTEEYAMPFIAFAIYIFLDYFQNHKITNLRLMICGFCFAGVFLLRANMIAVWIAGCVAVLIYSLMVEKKFPLKFILWFVAGAAILIVPIFIWLLAGGAFKDFITDYFLFNMTYSNNNNWGGHWSELKVMVIFAQFDLFLIGVIILLISIYRGGKDKKIYVGYLAYMFVTLYLASISGLTFRHYTMIMVPMYVYPLAMLCKQWDFEKNSGIKVLFAILLVTISA